MPEVTKSFNKTFGVPEDGALVVIDSLEYAAVNNVFKVASSVLPDSIDGEVMVYLEGCSMPIKHSLLTSAKAFIDYRTNNGITLEMADKLKAQIALLED